MKGQGAGHSVPRVDGRDKVTGEARFSIDTTTPGMLHGHVARSTRGHARILEIRTERALEAPGVAAVVTADDLTGLFPRFGHILADHPILAISKVRYFGEPVALVVAETPHMAADAADLLDIRYEDLPVVLSPDDALRGDAPLLHEQNYALGNKSFSDAHPASSTPSNLLSEVSLEWGDPDPAFAEAALVVETAARYPMLYAYAMEPYNAVATFQGPVLEVVSTAQHPYQVREDLARIFDLPLSKVRVRSPFLGGGFGSKSYTKIEPLAAVGAWATGRPVKVSLDVEQSILTTRSDSAEVVVRSGFDLEGRILVRDFRLTLNTGAYADNGPLVLSKAVYRCSGPYAIENLRVVGRAVYTNTVPSSSYRGFGAPQGNLAGEMNIDQAAQKLGIDPGELRRLNLVRPGMRHIPGKRAMDADLVADLELVLDKLGWDQAPTGENRGIGFGCSASDAGAVPVSTAIVRLLADQSALVLTGSTEMGQGSRTVLSQIAATELGVDLELIQIVQSDTAVTPYERTTGASRTTTLTGLAVQRACREVLTKLEEMGAEVMNCPPDRVTASGGIVTGPDSEMTYETVIQEWFGGREGEVLGHGLVRRAGELEELPPFWEIGMVGVEVLVDPDTGRVTVDHLVTVGDVGYALNPALVEGQDLGAATQGLGAALHEELIYDGAQLANASLVDYRVPHMADMPRVIDSIVAQRNDGIGPYGSKGGGEGSFNPIGGAVASAVARAIGRWPDELPLTPPRVWELIHPEGQEAADGGSLGNA